MRARWVCGFGASLVIACSSGGGDDGGGGSGSVTSIDSAKSAQTLSDGEAEQYCKDLQAYMTAHMPALKKVACSLGSAFATITAKTDDEAKSLCRKAFDDCMAAPGDASPGTNTCAEFIGKLKSCPATIGDLNQCIVDQVRGLEALDASAICASAKAPSSSQSMSPQPSPAFTVPESCTRLETSCPNFLQSSSSSSEQEPARP
jgi:hypothetical protein